MTQYKQAIDAIGLTVEVDGASILIEMPGFGPKKISMVFGHTMVFSVEHWMNDSELRLADQGFCWVSPRFKCTKELQGEIVAMLKQAKHHARVFDRGR